MVLPQPPFWFSTAIIFIYTNTSNTDPVNSLCSYLCLTSTIYNTGIILCSKITNSLTCTTNTVILVATDYNVTTGLTENTETITDLVVFPNPTSNFITLNIASLKVLL